MSLKTKISTDEMDRLVKGTQTYLENELNISLGQFDVQFLLDHVITLVEPKIYNQGVEDAMAEYQQSMEATLENMDILKVL